ncbi:probable lipid phosphate phosphatase beta [Coffea eugenioides]|uniref:probable lipid phosphate phosphatase beta n=1 Tax=Coffea eugenioides TaxID=49369 RepID=UPI000F611219|nr:probable lipid phosphate phosphatase beta [Coffea eugenioides]
MGSTSPTIPPPPSSVLRDLIKFDTALSLRLYTITQPILPYSLLKSLEFSGDGRLFFPLILSLLLYPLSITTAATTNPFLLDLFLGALLDLLLIGLLKHLIRRPRPVYNKNMFVSFAVDHWSFPSGHSSRVSFIATLFYFYSNWVRNLLINSRLNQFVVENIVLIVASWAVITSVSRVLLGRHFVLDVFAGMFLGVLEGFFVFRVFNSENLSSFLR